MLALHTLAYIIDFLTGFCSWLVCKMNYFKVLFPCSDVSKLFLAYLVIFCVYQSKCSFLLSSFECGIGFCSGSDCLFASSLVSFSFLLTTCMSLVLLAVFPNFFLESFTPFTYWSLAQWQRILWPLLFLVGMLFFMKRGVPSETLNQVLCIALPQAKDCVSSWGLTLWKIILF